MTGRQHESRDLFRLMVREFRLWQSLLRLAGEERRLLADGDVSGLIELAQRKNEALSHLGDCHQQRNQIAPDLAIPPAHSAAGREEIHTISDLPEDEALRLSRILEGIRTLAWQVGELTRGNYALADCSTRRLWSIQSAIYLWAQGEAQTSLPLLLSELDVDKVNAKQPEKLDSPRTA